MAIVSSLGGETAQLLADHQCAIHYEPGNVERLVDALRALLDRPDLLTSMQENARPLFETQFDAANIYRQMAQHVIGLGTSLKCDRS